MPKKLKLKGSAKTYKNFRTNTGKKKKKKEKDVLFITGHWNEKVGSQEIFEYQAILALEYKMKQGKD